MTKTNSTARTDKLATQAHDDEMILPSSLLGVTKLNNIIATESGRVVIENEWPKSNNSYEVKITAIDQDDFIHPELTKAQVSAALETSKLMNRLLVGWIVIFLVVLFTIGMPNQAHAGGSYMTCDASDGSVYCQSQPVHNDNNDNNSNNGGSYMTCDASDGSMFCQSHPSNH